MSDEIERRVTQVTSDVTELTEGDTIEISAEDTEYSTDELRADAGEVTVKFENKDEGIRHNFHVFKGSDDSGQSVGMTEITAGPDEQETTLTLTSGEHYYQCDVHSGQMNGTLTVGD